MKKLILFLSIGVFMAFGILSYAFDEDSEISIGVKRGTKVVILKAGGPTKSEIKFRRYSKKAKRFYNMKDFDAVKSGELFMIAVRNNRKSHVYVLNIDTSNKLTVLFPNKGIDQPNPLKAGQRFTLPPDTEKESLMYRFDRTEGIETFYTFVSTKPILAIEKIIKKIPKNGLVLGEDDDFVDELESAYKTGNSRISLDPNFPNSIWFMGHYAKKMVILHGKKGKRILALRGRPLKKQKITLIADKIYKINTTKRGTLHLSLDHAGRGIIKVNYNGSLVKGRIKLYNKPMRYKIYVKDLTEFYHTKNVDDDENQVYQIKIEEMPL